MQFNARLGAILLQHFEEEFGVPLNLEDASTASGYGRDEEGANLLRREHDRSLDHC